MIFEKEREGATMAALDAFDSFLFSLKQSLLQPSRSLRSDPGLPFFFFSFFFNLLRFALTVSFFRSKIHLVAEKVEELKVFILYCLLFLNLMYVIEPFGYIWFDLVDVASFIYLFIFLVC